MRDLYIKEGEGFLLVFSLVSDGTLTSIERLVEQIQKVKDEDVVPMTLVGNKADLVEKRQVRTTG
jgi:Ras-related protein Rap-1A/Ras-related protein Rap-1B